MSATEQMQRGFDAIAARHDRLRQTVNESWQFHPWLERREPRVGLVLVVAVALGGVWLASWPAYWIIQATGPVWGRAIALVCVGVAWSSLEFADAAGYINRQDQ